MIWCICFAYEKALYSALHVFIRIYMYGKQSAMNIEYRGIRERDWLLRFASEWDNAIENSRRFTNQRADTNGFHAFTYNELQILDDIQAGFCCGQLFQRGIASCLPLCVNARRCTHSANYVCLSLWSPRQCCRETIVCVCHTQSYIPFVTKSTGNTFPLFYFIQQFNCQCINLI